MDATIGEGSFNEMQMPSKHVRKIFSRVCWMTGRISESGRVAMVRTWMAPGGMVLKIVIFFSMIMPLGLEAMTSRSWIIRVGVLGGRMFATNLRWALQGKISTLSGDRIRTFQR